jgi:ATP-binding cassette subfamily B protein
MLSASQLPPPLAAALSAKLDQNESVLYAQASDLTRDQKFGQSFLAVTRQRVAVMDAASLSFTLLLSEIKEVKVDELFGGAQLTAETKSGGERRLICYTKAVVPEFAVICRIINQLCEGREPAVPDKTEAAYCANCGAPLPERGANCTACVRRFQVFLRLLGLLKPYRAKATLLVLCTFFTVVAQLAPPYLTKLIVDGVIREKNPRHLGLLIGAMLGCGLLMLASRLASGILMSWLGARLVTDLRSRLHAALQRLPLNYYQRRDSGEIIGRVMNDTGELQHFLIDGLPFFMVNCISFVAIAGILLCIDMHLALLVFLPVPFLLGGGGWFWKRLIPLFHKHGSRIGALHSTLNESIYGIKIVKAFAQEHERMSRFDNTNEKLFHTRFAIERTFIGFSEVMSWIMTVGIAAVWYFAARRICGDDPRLTVGDLLAFVGYIWLFFGPVQWFTAVMNWMTHAFSGAERVFSVLDSPPEVYESPAAVSLPVIKGAIDFKDVRFSYERGKEIIKGVSFHVEPGAMIGLVGKSGAGKSTLISLICRFYDPDSGSIEIDGHPIRDIKLEQLRRQIGIVPQDPFLFNASILENIRYGRPEATFDDVLRSARAANAHEFILDKEDGYDTMIGEKGTMLSGGEKQRLAIARAILHDPPILILDEATSSVDSETEKAIQEAIAALIKGRTTIAIAHRLATLRNAKRLIVIEDGKLVEEGTHDQLLEKDGTYAKLVKMQTEINRITAEAVVWR